MENKPEIPALNFHLIKQCNMRCKFCFATFNDVPKVGIPKGYLSKEETHLLISKLKLAGFTKINFAGGEPLIHPHIADHIAYAKSIGFITSIVTNGSKVNAEFLSGMEGKLDYVGLSIDSLSEDTNRLSGRAIGGKTALDLEFYSKTCEAVKRRGIGLKINTVVNALNHNSDMSDFINQVKPMRWKLFQMLPVQGQNDIYAEQMAITSLDYQNFVQKHLSLCPEIEVIPESNEIMTGSYIMIDPAGRFFDNTEGHHTYSEPILKIGVNPALAQVNQSLPRYLERKGNYFEKTTV